MADHGPRNELQEIFQRRHIAELPAFTTARDSGPDHMPRFTATVSHSSWGGRTYFASGATIVAAEQAAAGAALAAEPTLRPPAL